VSEIIYHYTNAAGLYGIIESKSVWATDVWFMNDTGEGTFGWQRIEQFLKSKNPGSDAEKGVVDHALEMINGVRDMIVRGDSYVVADDSYIACFSKQEDSLSQWRAYGDHGGFSLGFCRDALEQLGASPLANPQFLLKDVAYETAEQEDLLEAEYHKSVTIKIMNQEAPPSGFMFAASAAANILPWLKDSAFQEEAEVRLHTFNAPAHQVFTRISAMGLTPYTPIAICEAGNSLTTIRKVVIGPQRHPAEAMRAVKKLLAKNGLTDIQVTQSAAPLRL
jgi:hypothetical protein